MLTTFGKKVKILVNDQNFSSRLIVELVFTGRFWARIRRQIQEPLPGGTPGSMKRPGAAAFPQKAGV